MEDWEDEEDYYSGGRRNSIDDEERVTVQVALNAYRDDEDPLDFETLVDLWEFLEVFCDGIKEGFA